MFTRKTAAFALILMALPIATEARDLRSQHLPEGVSALPAQETQARRLLQEAIDCGLKGEVFHVQGSSEKAHVLQTGAYFLVRGLDFSGVCSTQHWLFLRDPDLRREILEKIAAGVQVVLFNPSALEVHADRFRVDAVAVPPGEKTAAGIFSSHIDPRHPLLVVTPSMSRAIFVHEFQHFEDYGQNLPKQLKAEANALGFPDEATQVLLHFVMESRAYGRQLEFLRTTRRAAEYDVDADQDIALYNGPKWRQVLRQELRESFNANYITVVAEGLQNMKSQDPSAFKQLIGFLKDNLRKSDIAALEIAKAIPELSIAWNCEQSLVSVVPVTAATDIHL